VIKCGDQRQIKPNPIHIKRGGLPLEAARKRGNGRQRRTADRPSTLIGVHREREEEKGERLAGAERARGSARQHLIWIHQQKGKGRAVMAEVESIESARWNQAPKLV